MAAPLAPPRSRPVAFGMPDIPLFFGMHSGTSDAPGAPVNALQELWFRKRFDNDYKTLAALASPVRPSMRHQHRHCHGGKNAAGDAAQDEFAQPRMPIAAEHHEFGADIGGVGEDCI